MIRAGKCVLRVEFRRVQAQYDWTDYEKGTRYYTDRDWLEIRDSEGHPVASYPRDSVIRVFYKEEE